MSSESPTNFADLIPLAEDSDPEEVVTALETAQVFAARDPREALRWLRRAAEAADDAGRDNRSLALARTAAELANHLAPAAQSAAASESVAPPPPPSQAAEAESVIELSPSMRPPPPSQRSSARPTPPPKPSIRPAPPSAASAAENLTPAPPSVTSRAPAKPTASLTPSTTRSVGKSLPPEKPSKPSRAPLSPSATPAAPSVGPSVAAPAVSRPPPKPTYTTPEALLGSEGSQVIERLMREGRAETVSVKRSARDPSLFVVRTGAAQGIGSRRALIVLLEDDTDFFSDEQPDFAN